VVSTQSPCTLAPELLELASVVLLHRFFSRDWFDFLCRKLPLEPAHEQLIRELPQGYALAFSPQHRVEGAEGSNVLIKVRARITTDLGATRSNNAADREAAPSSSGGHYADGMINDGTNSSVTIAGSTLDDSDAIVRSDQDT
jgi:hypothetical protein